MNQDVKSKQLQSKNAGSAIHFQTNPEGSDQDLKVDVNHVPGVMHSLVSTSEFDIPTNVVRLFSESLKQKLLESISSN